MYKSLSQQGAAGGVRKGGKSGTPKFHTGCPVLQGQLCYFCSSSSWSTSLSTPGHPTSILGPELSRLSSDWESPGCSDEPIDRDGSSRKGCWGDPKMLTVCKRKKDALEGKSESKGWICTSRRSVAILWGWGGYGPGPPFLKERETEALLGPAYPHKGLRPQDLRAADEGWQGSHGEPWGWGRILHPAPQDSPTGKLSFGGPRTPPHLALHVQDKHGRGRHGGGSLAGR